MLEILEELFVALGRTPQREGGELQFPTASVRLSADGQWLEMSHSGGEYATVSKNRQECVLAAYYYIADTLGGRYAPPAYPIEHILNPIMRRHGCRV
jgi:hypothetical protein